MTLYLWIAAYLACAVLSYGVLCGRFWREFGKWDRDLTGLALYGAVFWPICVPLELLTHRGTICPRWYFRSRKPAKKSAPRPADCCNPVRVEDVLDPLIKRQLDSLMATCDRLDKEALERRRQQFRDTGPQEGTVAHKMRSLSEDAEKLRAEERAVKLRRFKLDALSWAVERISHTAKAGFRNAVFNDDPLNPETWDGCKAVAHALPGSYFMRSEVLPFLNDSLSGMGFRCDAVWGGKGSLYGITRIRVEW